MNASSRVLNGIFLNIRSCDERQCIIIIIFFFFFINFFSFSNVYFGGICLGQKSPQLPPKDSLSDGFLKF